MVFFLFLSKRWDEEVKEEGKRRGKREVVDDNCIFSFFLDVYETKAFLEPIHSIHSSQAKQEMKGHTKNARVRPINEVASQRAHAVHCIPWVF